MNEPECWPKAVSHIERGDIKRAVALCEQEPCSNTVECQRYLGWVYYQEDNLDKALTWFSRAASQGDGDALYGIGSLYFVRRDFKLALQYYERAAERGYARAYHWIAYIHHQGLGTTKNIDTAAAYYRRSAAQGYLIADRALLHMMWQGSHFFQRLAMLPKYLYLVARAAVIAFRNINDPRIADVPNAFEKKARQR